MLLHRIVAATLIGLTSAALPCLSGLREEDILRQLKLAQQQMLLREPAERAEKLERLRSWRTRAGKRARRLPSPVTDLGRISGWSSTPNAIGTVSTVVNSRVNDPTGEPFGAAQSEVSIAALGSHVVAAYNDGIGFYGPPFPEDTQGYSYSTDGGLSWIDGGAVPNAGLFVWVSDPVVVVNEKTGAFYYCGLVDFPGGQNGIAAVKGTFSGSSFSWGPPTIVRTVPNSSALLDKQWMAVDSLTGNLYTTYSTFVVGPGGFIITDSIQLQRSTDDLQTWSSPLTLSSAGDAGLVQGSRPAVGPDGEVYAVWHAIGQVAGPGANSPFGRDFLRIRKSTNQGVSFGAQATAESLFTNFGNGAPGFNRGFGLTFPGIAVDRGAGPNRGRVYLTWNESLNFYNDPFPEPGIDPQRSEIENNNSPTNATPFNPGDLLRGTVSVTGSPGDLDYWRWDAVQGQTVIFYLDSLDANLDAAFRIFCSDGVTLLAFSQNGYGGQGLLVFTVPTSGTYYMRMASYSGSRIGRYRILTTLNTPQADRARDHRDLMVVSSTNGTTWQPPARVNDGPPWFDDWLPEVAVDGSGQAVVAAYDWRDSPAICGGGSNVYLYRSVDAGETWSPGSGITEVTTNWTTTFSTMIPNQGDYIGLFVAGMTAQVAWADGRNGDPDVYSAMVTTAASALRAHAGNDTSVECSSADGLGTPVRLDGSTSEGAVTYLWTAAGIAFDDAHSPTPTGRFPLGATLVVLEVGDGARISRDSVVVTVLDTSPPTIRVVLAPALLWPPNHSLAGIHATVDADDGCGAVAVQLVSITSSESDEGPDHGDLPGDIQGAELNTADFDFELRAERHASGDGRVYEVCYRAYDGSGNSQGACGLVLVPHDRRGRARIESGSETSRLVILGSTSMVAASVDAGSAEIGTGDFQRFLPVSKGYAQQDVNVDGFSDLALPLEDEAFRNLSTSEPLFARWLAGGLGYQAEVERVGITGVEALAGTPFAVTVGPNPTRGFASFRYSLPRPGHVRLLIFDVSGHIVARLVDGPLDAGQYQARFPKSSPKSAQLYLYRLDWGGKALTGKLVVVP